MKKLLLIACVSFGISTLPGYAQHCTSIPNTLTNGTTADATQVMGNFAYLGGCTASTANPSFTGYAGIGTTSPAAILHVYTDTDTTNESTSDPLTLGSFTIGQMRMYFGVNNANTYTFIGSVKTGDSYEPLILQPNGNNVGIGNTAPAYLLHVGSSSPSGAVMELQNSSGGCTHTPSSSSETVSCSSDQRLKKDIADAPSALPWLGDMQVRDFTIRATGERKTGVIAQEILRTHPDMVHLGPDGFYKVDEPNPWKLIKAIQELKAANDVLAERIASDTRRLVALEFANTALKSKLSESAIQSAQIAQLQLRVDAILKRSHRDKNANQSALRKSAVRLANSNSGP